MFFGMLVMLVLMTMGIGFCVRAIGGQLIEHVKDDPEAADALRRHLLEPLVRKPVDKRS